MIIIPGWKQKWSYKFKDHVATFQDLGNVKILDFANPESSVHHIRFLFDESQYLLHISGDLGHLTARNRDNMTLEGFKSFLSSPEYFEQKVISSSRPMVEYDRSIMHSYIRDLLEKNPRYVRGIACDLVCEEDIDEILEFVDEHFYSDTGISEQDAEAISNNIPNLSLGDVLSFGKIRTGYSDLYLYAFDLAMRQPNKKTPIDFKMI